MSIKDGFEFIDVLKYGAVKKETQPLAEMMRSTPHVGWFDGIARLCAMRLAEQLKPVASQLVGRAVAREYAAIIGDLWVNGSDGLKMVYSRLRIFSEENQMVVIPWAAISAASEGQASAVICGEHKDIMVALANCVGFIGRGMNPDDREDFHNEVVAVWQGRMKTAR